MPEPLVPDAVTPIALEFELTHDDLVDASVAMARRSRSRRVVSVGLLAGFSTALLAAAQVLGEDWAGSFVVGLLAAVGFAGFQALIVPRIQREQVSAMLREGQNLFLAGRQQLVIDDGGVTASNWVTQTHVRWAGVERVVVSERHVLVYFGAARALIVPRRAFSSEESMRAFVASAERRRAMALEAVRPPPALPGAGG